MRLIGSLVIVAALAFAGCSKPSSTQTEDEQSPAPSTPAGTTAKKESPPAPPASKETAPPSPATANTPPSDLAPEGVYYVVSNVRVETSAGVQVLLPGTGVRKIRPGVYLTPLGEAQLAQNQVTNIISVARAARDASQAEQAALKRMATPAAVMQRARVEAQKPDANHLAAVKQMETDQAKRELATLAQQKAAIQSQIDALGIKLAKENYNQNIKGRKVLSTTGQQMNTAQSQLQAVEAQIAAAYDKLNALR